MQILDAELIAAVADDHLARHIEYIDPPIGLDREQIGCHTQQLIGISKRTLGDAAPGTDIPVAIGFAMDSEDSLLRFAHRRKAAWIERNKMSAKLPKTCGSD